MEIFPEESLFGNVNKHTIHNEKYPYYLYEDIVDVFGNTFTKKDKELFINFTNEDLENFTTHVYFSQEGIYEESPDILIGKMVYKNKIYYYYLNAFCPYYTGYEIGGEYKLYITKSKKFLIDKCLDKNLREEYF